MGLLYNDHHGFQLICQLTCV